MTRVLFVGQHPETVDFSDPAIPRGFNAEKIHGGIEIALSKMAERGWQADPCLIPPGETARFVLDKQLATTPYDCVVIGAGIRLPPKSLSLLETAINAVHKAAPHASIAFNTRPEDRPKPLLAGYKPIDRRVRKCRELRRVNQSQTTAA